VKQAFKELDAPTKELNKKQSLSRMKHFTPRMDVASLIAYKEYQKDQLHAEIGKFPGAQHYDQS
jgi:hypothetical protein